MATTISTYEQQAIDFLNKYGATIEIKFLHSGKYFDDDKEERDIYEITLKRGNRSYTFNFGQSLANSGFYYTKGEQKLPLERNLVDNKNLVSYIIRRDRDFLHDGESDTIHFPVTPTAYDVLACIQKYEVGTFEDFCSEFGYDTDSRKAEKTYQAVKEEYLNISRLFNEDELEEMREIN